MHQGPVRPEASNLPQLMRDLGYDATCMGLCGNKSSSRFDTNLGCRAWGNLEEGQLDKVLEFNRVTVPELDRLIDQDWPFFMLLRHMDPHLKCCSELSDGDRSCRHA